MACRSLAPVTERRNEPRWTAVAESVWLAWFLVDLLKKFIPICELRNDSALEFCQTHLKDQGSSRIPRLGWRWRGYFDDGTPGLASESGSDHRFIATIVGDISGKLILARETSSSLQRLLIRDKEK
jgi:hypothetical protein